MSIEEEFAFLMADTERGVFDLVFDETDLETLIQRIEEAPPEGLDDSGYASADGPDVNGWIQGRQIWFTLGKPGPECKVRAGIGLKELRTQLARLQA